MITQIIKQSLRAQHSTITKLPSNWASHPAWAPLASWQNSVSNKDVPATVNLYHKNATLWPTLSSHFRFNTENELQPYFIDFLGKIQHKEKLPEDKEFNAVLHPINCRQIGENAYNWEGWSEFGLTDGSFVKARFTYLVEKIDGEWKISHHHNSLMP